MSTQKYDLERNARTEPPRTSCWAIASAETATRTDQMRHALDAACPKQALASGALAAHVLTTEREIDTLATSHIITLSTECFNSFELIEKITIKKQLKN